MVAIARALAVALQNQRSSASSGRLPQSLHSRYLAARRAPDIANSILAKIAKHDVFVPNITIVNAGSACPSDLQPNPPLAQDLAADQSGYLTDLTALPLGKPWVILIMTT